MYEVYIDDSLMYSPVLSCEGYGLLSAKITKEINKAGSFEFVLPPNNVMYRDIEKMKSVITVKQDGKEIFRGRALHDEKDFYKRKKVYCEGELAFLLDSIQRPYEFQGSPSDLFKQFLNNHNSQVDSWKQFTVGNITVTDSNDYINRSNSNYSDTWEALNEKLIDTHGGYLVTRFENNTRYIDYLSEIGEESDQIIRFGENLLDVTEYVTGEDVFTVLIPIGAEQTDADGNSIGKLTIESVNNGVDYLESTSGISLFGRITKVQEWKDVTEPSNLKTKGQNFLNDSISESVSLVLKAIDLHLTDVNIESFDVGYKIKVISDPHGINTMFQCTKVELDLINPKNSVYTFGITFKALTSKNIDDQKKAYTKEGLTKEKVTEITKNIIFSDHIEASDFTFINSIKMIDSNKKMTASKLFEIMSTTTDESGDNNNVLANINMDNMYDLDICANHSVDFITQVVNMNLARTFEVSSAEVVISGEKSNGLVDSGIFLKGNVFSQDPIRMDSGSYVHIAKGTNGSSGYVKFVQLKITKSYQNGAIIIHVIQRNTVENIITIMFNSENTNDPTLKVFSNYGEQKYYIVKSSTSTWDLYGQKTEAYDSIYVSQYYKHSYLTGVTLTWTDTHANSLPSGYTTSTIYDTGWITISSFSNSLSQSSQSFSPTCAYRKIGNHVYIRGHIQTPSSWTGSTASTVFTIPSGYRPSTRKYVMNAMTGSRLARVFIDTNGNLTLEWTRNMSDGSAVSGALTWVDISIDYFTN